MKPLQFPTSHQSVAHPRSTAALGGVPPTRSFGRSTRRLTALALAAVLFAACDPSQYSKTRQAASQAATQVGAAAQEEIVKPAVETLKKEGREIRDWARSQASQAATQIAPRVGQAKAAATQAADKVRRAAEKAAEELKK